MTRPERVRRLSAEFSLGSDPTSVRQRVEAFEALLERIIVVPGLNQSVGLDAIIGLVPVAGDLIGGAFAFYLVWEARNLGMSRWQLARMLANIGIDTLIGLVPVAGDLFDVLFRSNSRNLRLIRKHLDRHHPETRIIDG